LKRKRRKTKSDINKQEDWFEIELKVESE